MKVNRLALTQRSTCETVRQSEPPMDSPMQDETSRHDRPANLPGGGARYGRVLLKLSGEALSGGRKDDILDHDAIAHIVQEILTVRELGVEIAIVVGGGNIFRGTISRHWQIERAEADNMGMLGTVINGVMLRAALNAASKFEVRLMSAINIPEICEPYIRLRADRHLAKGSIVVLTGGIGQPFVTTDYPSVQRAIELRCDAVLAAKNGVDGVFTADPRVDPSAQLYESVSYDEAIARHLRVMDLQALVLARDHGMPIHMFNFDRHGVMRRLCQGEDLGTYLANDTPTRLVDAEPPKAAAGA